MADINKRQGTFGYGYMWWIWDDPKAVESYEGQPTRPVHQGATRPGYGYRPQDSCSSQKTLRPYENQYVGITERLITARTESRDP